MERLELAQREDDVRFQGESHSGEPGKERDPAFTSGMCFTDGGLAESHRSRGEEGR